MNNKMQNIAVLIEFLVGSGLAIFFHKVLRYPEAAYTIFGIGILLSLVTYLLRVCIEKTREELLEQYHQAHELTDVFSKPGKYFGRKTSMPLEVAKYLHLYELVEHSAYAVSLEDDKIILAGEVIPLAS